MIRVFLGLTIFIQLTFDLVPAGPALNHAIASQSLKAFTWVGWLDWAVCAALAYGFIVYAAVGARMPDARPGLGWITFALVVFAILGAGLAFGVAGAGGRDVTALAIALVAFALLGGPIAIVAHIALAIGVLKLLFNLEGRDARNDFEAASDAGAPAVDRGAAPAIAKAGARGVDGIRAALASAPQDLLLHQRLHAALVADPARQAEMLEHARQFLALLVKGSRSEAALQVLLECLERDAEFKPLTDQVVPLAKLAIARGHGLVALRIMNRFERLNPNHASTASVYFLSARAFRDLKQLPRARQLLDTMLARFPDDPLAHDARLLRSALDRT